MPPLFYAEMLTQAGINFEAFGLELEIGVPRTGSFTRDLFQLSYLLDKFSTLGRPVFLTAVCAPGPGDGRTRPTRPTGGSTRAARANGTGRGTRNLQAEWMEAVYHMALSKPFVESIAWANLADMNHTIPGGGMLDDMLRPKPAFNKLQQMREKFRQFQKK